MTKIKEHIESMIKKAAEADDSGDAQRFAQAALNAAHVLATYDAMKEKP